MYVHFCLILGHKFSKDGSKQALLNLTQDAEKVCHWELCWQLTVTLRPDCGLVELGLVSDYILGSPNAMF